MTELHSITLRNAGDGDQDDLDRLAQLDSARPLSGAAVVALVDGRPVAAASLQDGSVVADPFVSSADAVALLRARLAAVHSNDRPRRRRFAPRMPRLRAA
jgi:hypothetical protein